MEQRLKNVRQVFLDMDGTIYHGSRLYPTTIPFLNFLKSRGIGYKFLSNNSSFSTAEYVSKLGRLGIDAAADEFYRQGLSWGLSRWLWVLLQLFFLLP